MRFAPYVLCVPLVACLAAGCRTKAPPERGVIQAQALTNNIADLSNAVWRAGAPAAGAIQDNWLASFNDAQLMALVNEALTNNLDLKAASFQVEKAAAQVDLAKSALRPAIRVLGTGGINASGGDASSALQAISLGVSWP